MDPNALPLANTQPPQPATLREKISETSGEFVKDHYEGFLHKLVNIIYSILKLLKNNIILMIKMVIGRE